jgi:hypothetical protein
MIGQEVRVADKIGTVTNTRSFMGRFFLFVRFADQSERCFDRSEVRAVR